MLLTMPADASQLSGEWLEGTITQVIYQSPDHDYVVLRLSPSGGGEVTAVGEMPNPIPGEQVRLRGRWEVHARFGRQFRFVEYELRREASAHALGRYLAETVRGVGPELARRLVEHFGSHTLAALEAGEERLQEAPGIGPRRAAALAAAWRQHRHLHELMIHLRALGLSPALARRVYRAYGARAIEIIEREPYRVAREVAGVGFLTADRLAQRAGLSPRDPQRLQAALLHVLREAVEEGHLYLPRERLVAQAAELTHIEPELVDHQLDNLVAAAEVVAERGAQEEVACYLPALLSSERRVAELLRALAGVRVRRAPPPDTAEQLLRHFEAYSGLELNPQQREAVLTTLTHPVSVITGGPGTGKTTVTQAVVWVWERQGRRVALAAPTGRAAKRLEEVSGHAAATIHRLLRYQPDGSFAHGPHDPLPYDLVIVDEASMVDMPLAQSLLEAVAAGTGLLLVGDADQLPPVGPGAFFAEVVASGALPTVRLQQIYRQAERSLIVTNAHRLMRGEALILPRPENWRGEDLLWVDVEAAARAEAHLRTPQGLEEPPHLQELALAKITNAVVRNLPRAGFAPHEIQVLSPMHRGLLGVENLNRHLQALLNPPSPAKPELRRGETVFRVGDRVLQTENNYHKGVFNGEIGQIAAIGPQGDLSVDFALGRIEYERSEVDQLELAYALTVHKSQGSEYPAVVLVVHSSHYIMLRRNLLYTALTRAERMAILIGDRKGLWKAIRTAPERERLTRLAGRLRGELPI
jgi:exodeoxyribonuclease V alpha subunit